MIIWHNKVNEVHIVAEIATGCLRRIENINICIELNIVGCRGASHLGVSLLGISPRV